MQRIDAPVLEQRPGSTAMCHHFGLVNATYLCPVGFSKMALCARRPFHMTTLRSSISDFIVNCESDNHSSLHDAVYDKGYSQNIKVFMRS
jgi:hypothetical protein